MPGRIISTEHLVDNLQTVYDIINKKLKHSNRSIFAHIDLQPGILYIISSLPEKDRRYPIDVHSPDPLEFRDDDYLSPSNQQ